MSDIIPDPKSHEVQVDGRSRIRLPMSDDQADANMVDVVDVKIPSHLNTQIILGGSMVAIAMPLLVLMILRMPPFNSISTLSYLILLPLCAAVVGVVSLCKGIQMLKPIRIPAGPDKLHSAMQEAKFQRYLIGLGYVLALLSICNVLLFAALSGDSGSQESVVIKSHGVNYLFSVSMAITGVLFFIASKIQKYSLSFRTLKTLTDSATNTQSGTIAIQDKSDAKLPKNVDVVEVAEEFCRSKFWGGLFYRVAESILFSMVFILLFHQTNPKDLPFALPVLCLLMGMFIESAEKTVVSLSDRVLAAVNAFYLSDKKSS